MIWAAVGASLFTGGVFGHLLGVISTDRLLARMSAEELKTLAERVRARKTR
jgi:hypothetical protein